MTDSSNGKTLTSAPLPPRRQVLKKMALLGAGGAAAFAIGATTRAHSDRKSVRLAQNDEGAGQDETEEGADEKKTSAKRTAEKKAARKKTTKKKTVKKAPARKKATKKKTVKKAPAQKKTTKKKAKKKTAKKKATNTPESNDGAETNSPD